MTPASNGMRVVDIHAHYYPETYLELFNTEGRRFDTDFRRSEQGFFFKTPIQSGGPLPDRFIDLAQRLADMDRQGVTVQALSLTGPMVNWGDAELSHHLATAWNDGAAAAHRASDRAGSGSGLR